METNNFADTLAFWISKRKMTQKALADKIGTTSNAISQYNTGERTPPFDKMTQIAEALGLTLPEFFDCESGDRPDIEFIDRVKAKPLAGTGGLETDGECIGKYSFHSSFIRRKGGSRDSMKIFEIDGDSMEPTLRPGDLIMINQKQDDIASGHIYLLRLEGELMVKRLEKRPGGIILVRSDNERYDPIHITPDMEDVDLQIFGRMVWSCREY